MVVRTSRYTVLAALAAVGLTVTVGAKAQDTITQTFSVPAQGIGFKQTIPYNTFNTALGALTNVNWTMVTTMSVTSYVLNLTGVEQPFWSVSTAVPVSFTVTD